MTKAIDVSAAPPATQEQCYCLRTSGIVKAVVGTSWTYGGVPADRIAAFRAGGLIVAEYQFPQRLVAPITEEWWCDVESPPGASRQQIQDACRRDPRPYGIYSNAMMWSTCGLNGYDVKAEFPWLKVWMADYGPLPRPFRPFGGFTEDDLAMVQYAGTAEVCGLSVDMSEIIEAPAPAPALEDTVIVACADSPSGYRLYQLAVPPVWITDPIAAQVLQDLSGPPKPASWGQLQALGAK